MMSGDDNDGQMIFGDLGGLKLPDNCLTGEEKPEKTSPRKLVPTGDRTQARCMSGTHATARPTAVDVTSCGLQCIGVGIWKNILFKITACISTLISVSHLITENKH